MNKCVLVFGVRGLLVRTGRGDSHSFMRSTLGICADEPLSLARRIKRVVCADSQSAPHEAVGITSAGTDQKPANTEDKNALVHLLDSEEEPLNNVQTELPFEVVLDSGAAEHVSDSVDAPGYSVEPSEGSKAGKGFIAANGARVPNRGQMTLSFKTDDNQPINSTFQVCQINRPF